MELHQKNVRSRGMPLLNAFMFLIDNAPGSNSLATFLTTFTNFPGPPSICKGSTIPCTWIPRVLTYPAAPALSPGGHVQTMQRVSPTLEL